MAVQIMIVIFVLYLQSICLAFESTECELTTGRTLTVIKSVRFPEHYGPNVDCRYAIRRRARSICSVTFLFNVLDVESSPGCTEDYLHFEDTGEKLCGSKPVGFSRTLSFKDQDNKTTHQKKTEVVMNFHSSNATHGGLGYMVTVVQQECPRPSCDNVYRQSDFSFFSPNYPLPYENGRICRYIVQKAHPTVCRLALTVKHFDVEEDAHCESDFLQLGDGKRICGVLDPGQIVESDFNNETIALQFESDHLTTRDGFQFDAHQVECSGTLQPQTLQLPSEGTTTTPLPPSTIDATTNGAVSRAAVE